MKCSVCEVPCGYGALCLTMVKDMLESVNLCSKCSRQLLGAEAVERLTRLLNVKAWVQPTLPGLAHL